ncbi:hypothetical protein Pyn_23480 [Prunus yedoensis var. nudiflora]|uniref:Uncharacterized protein n=1 Tax=Prunus yedoensis var. nudiflora TaxID=2094558 RepID=A0A315AVV7_PRUYE|nr:hypothetical protein Pyn_23480 [Prunus yedoensis var. nudiflora]
MFEYYQFENLDDFDENTRTIILLDDFALTWEELNDKLDVVACKIGLVYHVEDLCRKKLEEDNFRTITLLDDSTLTWEELNDKLDMVAHKIGLVHHVDLVEHLN